MKKYALVAAIAAMAVGAPLARADFQFNLAFTTIPTTSTSMFHGDDQWVLQVLNDGTNGTGTNLQAASVTLLSLNSNGTVNQSGVFYIRTWDATHGYYNSATPASNTAAAFQNEGTLDQSNNPRPDRSGSYVRFAGGWIGGSTPDETSQTYTDGQAVAWNSSVPTTSPQASGMHGSFNVVGTTAGDAVGINDATFQTLAQAVVPHGQLTAFDVTLAGASGNLTSKLILGLAGDANFDYSVNGADLSKLLGRYNTTTGNTWANGDFNGDGAVNGADLSLLLGNYNRTVTPQPMIASAVAALNAAIAVPEPAALGLFGLACGSLMIRRRRA